MIKKEYPEMPLKYESFDIGNISLQFKRVMKPKRNQSPSKNQIKSSFKTMATR
jgi:hypothetical protein